MKYLILTLPILLTACAEPKIEYVLVKPTVAADLLVPCEISERVATTYRELAILATEHLGTAQCANGKIVAVGKSLANRKD